MSFVHLVHLCRPSSISTLGKKGIQDKTHHRKDMTYLMHGINSSQARIVSNITTALVEMVWPARAWQLASNKGAMPFA